jgi:hypothetical protein
VPVENFLNICFIDIYEEVIPHLFRFRYDLLLLTAYLFPEVQIVFFIIAAFIDDTKKIA